MIHWLKDGCRSNVFWGFVLEVAELLWVLLWAGGVVLGLLWLALRLA